MCSVLPTCRGSSPAPGTRRGRGRRGSRNRHSPCGTGRRGSRRHHGGGRRRRAGAARAWAHDSRCPQEGAPAPVPEPPHRHRIFAVVSASAALVVGHPWLRSPSRLSASASQSTVALRAASPRCASMAVLDLARRPLLESVAVAAILLGSSETNAHPIDIASLNDVQRYLGEFDLSPEDMETRGGHVPVLHDQARGRGHPRREPHEGVPGDTGRRHRDAAGRTGTSRSARRTSSSRAAAGRFGSWPRG